MDEMLEKVKEEVAAIEQEMQPEEFLTELRQHLILSTNEFSTPVCDAKIRDVAKSILEKVIPAIESVSAAEAWAISKTARDSFRQKLESLREERSTEYRAILAVREPWRTRSHAASTKTLMSMPDNIIKVSQATADEFEFEGE